MGKYYKEINHTIYNKNVKNELKVMHITDIHYGYKSVDNLLNSLICKVIEYNPDYLLIGGDSYNDNNEIENLELKRNLLLFLKELSNICNTFYILGNHEMMGDHDVFRRNEELYNRIKEYVFFLDNSLYEDNNIRIVGKTLPFYSYLNSNIRKKLLIEDFIKDEHLLNLDNEKFNLLLTHSPQMLDDYEIRELLERFDIICTGHMHDGLLPPIINEIVAGSRGFISPLKEILPKNAKGTIKNDNQHLIISGGITKVRVSRILNKIYPRNIDKILITNDIEKKDYKIKTKYKIK